MPHQHIKPEINELARNMRNEPTKTESNKYIADFICFEKRLIIEVDGGQHNDNKDDKVRDKYLKQQNFKILRIWNNDILNNLDGVYLKIKNELETPSPEIRDFDPSAGEG